MIVNEILNEKVILVSVGVCETHMDAGLIMVDAYELKFKFQGTGCSVKVDADNLNWNLPKVEVLGSSTSVKYLKEACENKWWSLIKSKCKHFDLWMQSPKSLNAD